jgi:hypothetical protein
VIAALNEETYMYGEPHETDDLFLGVAVIPVAGTAPGDQAAIDQALRLVADYHADLGAELGRPSVPASIVALRRSPLGRKLRRLTALARGTEDGVPSDVRRQADDVIALLLRPLAATDYYVPAWFWRTSLGRLLAAAIHRTYAVDDLFCPGSAAERLNVDSKTVDRWLADGTLDAVHDETGATYVPVRTVERLRAIARELECPTRIPPDESGPPIVA